MLRGGRTFQELMSFKTDATIGICGRAKRPAKDAEFDRI